MSLELRTEELEKELRESQIEIEHLRNANNDLLRSHNKLKDELYKFHDFFNSSTSLLAIFYGKDHIIDVANDAIIEVWGKGNEVKGKPLFQVLPELKEQGIGDLLDRVYETGEPFYAEELPVELVIDGKPEMHYFDFTYQPQRNAQGEIIGVADIATDVTKRALLNRKIHKSEIEFRELVNFMPHKISLANKEGDPVFYNKNWLDYVGKSLEEFIDEPWLEMIHPEEQEIVRENVARCLKYECDFEVEARFLNKEGNYEWHLVKATPIRDKKGKITSWISSSTEIQKIKEEEKRKEDFLKLVSHELKTPVTSIKGYVQLLLAILPNKNSDSDKRLKIKPYLNRIETQVERLIRLLSEMLDISRIEQNELGLKIEKFNLNMHVREILEDLRYSNTDIELDLEQQYDCEVYADKDRIGQVIINFVTNALKYSPDSNKVQVKVHEHENGEVAVSVRDYGIGIDEKEQAQIFKRFYRVSGNNDNTYEGFGIGLYLSKEIIQRHSGKIFVKSKIGKGSEFTFTIPLNQNK